MIKIVVADENYLSREGLKKVFDSEVDLRLAAETKTAYDLLSLVRGGDLDFDLIILELAIPGNTGVDIIKNLLAIDDKLKILAITSHPEERYAVRAMKAGAMGYLTKYNLKEKLLPAIRNISLGNKFFGEEVSNLLLMEVRGESLENPHEKLSDREFQVLRALGLGNTIAEIAEKLSISESAVHTYKSRLTDKMGIDSNAELIRYAIENKLV